MKKLAIIALAAVAGGASAVELYDNGTTIEGTNGGQNISVLNLPGSSFGPSASDFAQIFLADDFNVTGPGWRLTSVSFYAFSTNATTFTYNRVRFSVVTGGNPNSGTEALNVNTTTLENGGIIGYRVFNGQESDRTRAIWRITVSGLNTILLPGQHMLRWSIGSTNFNGPFVPPVEPFTYTNGNAWQRLATGPYNPVYDPGFIDPDATPPNLVGQRFELPFTLNGEVVPEPATMIALGAGIAAIAARRRRK